MSITTMGIFKLSNSVLPNQYEIVLTFQTCQAAGSSSNSKDPQLSRSLSQLSFNIIQSVDAIPSGRIRSVSHYTEEQYFQTTSLIYHTTSAWGKEIIHLYSRRLHLIFVQYIATLLLVVQSEYGMKLYCVVNRTNLLLVYSRFLSKVEKPIFSSYVHSEHVLELYKIFFNIYLK